MGRSQNDGQAPGEGVLHRIDEWNQRSLEAADENRRRAANDHRVVDTSSGAVLVQVLPTGYAISNWFELELVLLPVGWLRHRLFHHGEYSVTVSRDRKHTSVQRLISRRSGMTLEQGRAVADETVAELAT